MSQEEHDKRIDYVELSATDLPQLKAFYSNVFGWTFTDWGPDYASFEDGRIGGGLRSAETVEPGGPLVIIYAVDLEAIERQGARRRHREGNIQFPRRETLSLPRSQWQCAFRVVGQIEF